MEGKVLRKGLEVTGGRSDHDSGPQERREPELIDVEPDESTDSRGGGIRP